MSNDSRITVPKTFNIATALIDDHIKDKRGERPAILYGNRRVSFLELSQSANRIGNALRDLGVEIEQRVLISLPDCPEFFEAFLGAMKIGAIPVPVSTYASAEDFRYFLADSRARAFITDSSLSKKLGAVGICSKHLESVLIVGGDAGRFQSYDEIKNAHSPQLQAVQTSADDASYWLYTSGTTGRPKAVVHLHHDMMHCVIPFGVDMAAVKRDDRIFSIPRMHTSYGLASSLYLTLLFGATAILSAERPDTAKMVEVLANFRPTLFFGVPTTYASLLNWARSSGPKPQVSSVRAFFSGGEALSRTVYSNWKEAFGSEILDVLGSTEVGYIFIGNRPAHSKPDSSGDWRMWDMEVRLVDENGADVGVGEAGDLLVKAESTAAYYWKNHEKTKSAFGGEWYRTADKFYHDADGYLHYLGRSDEMFKVSALWVSPIEVETVLSVHPAVAECAVVGESDGQGLTRAKAFVVIKRGSKATEKLAEEILVFVGGKLPRYKCPRSIEFLSEIPRTTGGKIQRVMLMRPSAEINS